MRKAQQEMVGFIIIILMVIVIGVILFGVYLRKDKAIDSSNAELGNFLEASLRYTTECAFRREPIYMNLRETAELCFNRIKCFGEIDACMILNETYSQMLPRMFGAGTILSYNLKFYFQPTINESVGRVPIMDIKSGNLSRCPIRKGSQNIGAGEEGYIFTELEICTED